jgi:hypothetical protein
MSAGSALILIAALFAALLCLSVPINAEINATVSVSVVQPVSPVQIALDGTANFAVSAHITFANIPEGYDSPPTVHEYFIEVALGTYGASPTNSLSGTIFSNPDNCAPNTPAFTFPFSGVACLITPACQFTTSSYCTGTEDVSFNVVLGNAQPRQYHFLVDAEVMPNSQIMYYAYNAYTDLYVNMQNAPRPQYTTPTYAAPTTFQSQPTSQNNPPEETPQFPGEFWSIIGVVVVVGLILGAVIYHLPTSRKAKSKQTKLDTITTEQPVQPHPELDSQPPTQNSTVTLANPSPDTMFCNQCGARIKRNSKFCKECGIKQT